MKKRILFIASVVLAGGMLTLNSCKKDDTTAPTITLTGDQTITIDLAQTFTDPGATASDDEDDSEDLTVTTTGSVDNSKVGTYILKYNVSDEAGNAATEVTRTVKVKSDKLAGSYSVDDVVTGANPSTGNGTYTYTVTVTQSSTEYNKIIIANFGGFGTSRTINATIDGSTITIASQTITPEGETTPTTITGSGSYNGTAFKITNITYTNSAAVYGNGSATYTKN